LEFWKIWGTRRNHGMQKEIPIFEYRRTT